MRRIATTRSRGPSRKKAARSLALPSVDPMLGAIVPGISKPKPPAAEEDMLWALGFGSWADLDQTPNVRGVNIQSRGFTCGHTRRLGTSWFGGVHGGYADSDVKTRQGPDRIDISSFQVGGHLTHSRGQHYLDVISSYGRHSYASQRFLQFGGLQRHAAGDFDGSEVSVQAEMGWKLDLGDPRPNGDGFLVLPQLSLAGRHLVQEGFTETGAGAASLDVQTNSLDLFQSALGVGLSHRSTWSDDTSLLLDLSLKWAHEFGDVDRVLTSSFVGGTRTFIVNGRRIDPDSVQVRAGVTGTSSRGFDTHLGYVGEFGDGLHSHSAVTRVSHRW